MDRQQKLHVRDFAWAEAENFWVWRMCHAFGVDDSVLQGLAQDHVVCFACFGFGTRTILLRIFILKSELWLLVGLCLLDKKPSSEV